MLRKLLVFFIALLLFCGCTAQIVDEVSIDKSNSYLQISMDEAIALMESESDYIILDVRMLDEFKTMHIPGAINIPNETIGTSDIVRLPDKEQLILVYCRSGNRSKQAAEKLVKLGYTNVVEFGGINEWPGETVSGNE